MKNKTRSYSGLFTLRATISCALFCVAALLGTFRFVSTASTAPNSAETRVGINAVVGFTFSTPQPLIRPPISVTPGVTLKDQDVEPEIKVDIFGNIYLTAIHGVPGGVDLWKSVDKGATFVYMGEPDGAQDKCDVTGTSACIAGAGGGDDSLDVSNGGYVYLASLYLGNTTVSASCDGATGGTVTGQAWAVNPCFCGHTGKRPAMDRRLRPANGLHDF